MALTLPATMAAFGDRLSLTRRTQSLTRKQLAKKSGYHASYIARLEYHSQPNITLLAVFCLAQALDVSPGYLLGFIEEPRT